MSRREPDAARYRALVRHELPAAARAGRWVLRHDHCGKPGKAAQRPA